MTRTRPTAARPNGFNPATGGNLYTGTKTAGACNNKIMLSVSNNAGASFTGSTVDPRLLPVVNTARGQATTDQWFQWAAFTPKGTLVTSYYDRQYGSAEITGDMDISVSTSSNLSTFKVTRATSASMPLPTQFPDANGQQPVLRRLRGRVGVVRRPPAVVGHQEPGRVPVPGHGHAECASRGVHRG